MFSRLVIAAVLTLAGPLAPTTAAASVAKHVADPHEALVAQLSQPVEGAPPPAADPAPRSDAGDTPAEHAEDDPAPSAQATSVAAPQPPPPTVPSPAQLAASSEDLARTDRKRGRELFVAGVAITAISYGIASLAGVITIDQAKKRSKDDAYTPMIDEGRRGRQDRKRGLSLLLPVAGPFLGLRHTDSAVRAYGLVTIGAAQLTGVAIMIAGAVRHSRGRPPSRVGFAAAPSPGGASAAVSVRF